MYKKLERELHEKKREIASVIDVSNIAYEARDQARIATPRALRIPASDALADARGPAAQAQNEIAALRAQADKEQAAFEAEYREARCMRALRGPGRGADARAHTQLGRLIEDDRRAREAALRAEAEKIYEYGQLEDEKKKKVKGLWGALRDKKPKGVTATPGTELAHDQAFAKIQVRRRAPRARGWRVRLTRLRPRRGAAPARRRQRASRTWRSCWLRLCRRRTTTSPCSTS